MAARFFDPKNLELVLVGNVGQFRDALKKEFPNATYEEIPFDQVDLLRPDLRKAKETVPAATPESLERGKAILMAAAEATGGAALGKIESLEATLTGQAFSPQGQIPIDVKVYMRLPSQIRVDVKTPAFGVKQGYDGKTAWVASPQGAMDLPANLNGEVQRGIDLEAGFGLFQQALAGKVQAQSLGEEEVEAKKVLAAAWTSAAGLTKLYFDPATHLLVGARYHQATLQGAVETLQRWSDFRTVEGVQIPFRWITYRNDAKFSETSVQEIKLNTKPDPALFSKPK